MGRPRGTPQSAEARRRISETLKRRWADPELRARHARASMTPAERRRHSERMRRLWADPTSGLRRRFPAMTEDQRRLYAKLRRIVGREAALAEVFREEYPK